MDKVSVIVPVYNAENTLCRCIESIVKQTHCNWELLLINDGSTDSSKEICDTYVEKDSRISVVHKVNEGVSRARNAGVEKACGEYVLFVDSDDYIDENALENLLEEAKKNEADVVVFGFFYHAEDTGNISPNFPEQTFVGNNYKFVAEAFEHTFRKELLNAPWNKLIRKSVIDANKIKFNPNFSICEDMIFSIEVLDVSERITVLDKAFYHYVYKQGDNLVNRFHNNFFEALNYFKIKTIGYLEKYNAKPSVLCTLDDFYVERIIAYLKKIYFASNYDKKTKYNVMKRICSHSMVQQAIKGYHPKGVKRKTVVFCVKNKLYMPLNLLYLGGTYVEKMGSKG